MSKGGGSVFDTRCLILGGVGTALRQMFFKKIRFRFVVRVSTIFISFLLK